MEIKLTETVLRDANQSLIATRLPLKDFAEILPVIDQCGYYSAECWGGATFDCCLRYLDEDPWERLRQIKKYMPNTKLQMLLRGQNILGYKHYPSDVVRKFVEYSVKNGIDIIRIFDALNDPRNMKVAVEETVKQGAMASCAISFTTSPVHTLEGFVKYGRELKEMGTSTLCIKDMAGIMGPQEAYDLISALKDALDMPIVLHTHCTTGLAYMTVVKAAQAGVDVIDTAISCFSGGTSQPATESVAYSLRQMGIDVKLDDKKTRQVNEFFKPIREKFAQEGVLDQKVFETDTAALIYQVPGGMLSNLISQLKAQNSMDKFDEVLAEVPSVRKDMGYPPLVTPTSQIVGVQAVNNVLAGERFKNVTKEVTAYMRGEYGTPPAPVNAELQKQILNGEKPLDCFYADTLEPAFEKTKAELGDTARSDEDVLSYIAFPSVAEKFFENRKAKEENKATYTIVEA